MAPDFSMSHAEHPHRPQNPRELFNLRHSMARNVIERIFGIIKRRFSLMVASPEYSEEKQAKFIPALCVLHNYISLYEQDIEDPTNAQQPLGTGGPGQAPPTNLSRPVWVSAQEERIASARRDRIADEMWADYQLHLTKRGV
jgi:DDE superfamily endonuclease